MIFCAQFHAEHLIVLKRVLKLVVLSFPFFTYSTNILLVVKSKTVTKGLYEHSSLNVLPVFEVAGHS